MFSPKDPAEEITIAFDFSEVITVISGIPVITVSVVSGTDPDYESVLSDVPQVFQNNKVLQRIRNGVSGVNYQFRCVATSETGEIFVHVDSIQVRTFPYVS